MHPDRKTELDKWDAYYQAHFDLFGELPKTDASTRYDVSNRGLIEKLGGEHRVVQLCLPEGIGDVSWVYSKLWALKGIIDREVIIYCAGERLKRAQDFIDHMLPNVHWGGYLDDRVSNQVVGQCLPPDWPHTEGLDRFVKPFIQNISANFHLEMGRPLAEWIPLLPVNYHYPMNYRPAAVALAERLLRVVGERFVVLYCSNYQKDTLSQGWAQWDIDGWEWFGKKLCETLDCGIVVVGAEYDRDKSSDLVTRLEAADKPVTAFINKPIDSVVHALTKAAYCVSYESGIGVLANVVNCPCLSLMSWPHMAIGLSSQDPVQTHLGHYLPMPNPSPELALASFLQRGKPHVDKRLAALS